MRHQRRLILTAFALTATWHGTVVTQQPVRTVAIGGQVLAAEGDVPLENARILHNLKPIAWTDASGRFDVVVARESSPLQVEKAGFVSETVDRTGVDLVVRMVRTVTLTVRVVNERGEPVPWRPFRVAGPAGGVIGRVDDRGEQRLAGLAPGRYAADLEDLPAPVPPNQADLADQMRELAEAREGTANASRSGRELRAGEDGSLTLTVPAPAAGPTRQARDGGTIRGRVSGPDGAPVRDARVWLKAPLTDTSTTTDDAGTYAFEGVQAGQYKLHAAAPGLVPREFGQDASGLPGRDLLLMPGMSLENIDVQLTRGSTVSGRVLDRRGEPYERFPVVLVEHVRQHGSERQDFLVAGSDVTDERGRFRISGVDPGAYYLVARPRGRSEAPVFYPGRLSIAEAMRVTTSAGVELSDMDVTIDWDQGASLSGIVFDPGGKPVRSGTVTLERAAFVEEPVFARQVPIGNDGAFAFLSVPPGDYAVWLGPRVVVSIRIEFGTTGFPQRPRLRVPTGGATVAVGTAAPVSLDIRTSLKPALSGRLMPEGGGTLTSPSSFELVTQRGARAVIRDDGTFDVPNLSGTTRFALAAAPRGWWLKSVMIGGVNAADTPIDFQDGSDSRHGVAALVSRTGEVTGRALDERGQPAAQASVLIFPVDREKWYAGSRYVRAVRAEAGGTFALEAPPGEYLMTAVSGRADMRERALSRLAPGATRIIVNAGEMVTRDVHVAPYREPRRRE